WLSPIRALTREIQRAAQRAADDLGLDWTVAIRSGDTSSSDRQKQMRKPPEMLITTPESLHLLLASKKNRQLFGNLRCVVADEWHELLGSKRGVQVELALSRLRALRPELKTWGISATIGNLEEAMLILLGHEGTGHLIRSGQDKQTKVVTVIPDEIETFPWAGHLGITLLQKVVPIIQDSGSTLIFTNTRAQCEIWYQRLLEAEPDLAGAIAMHHGSLDRKLRDWVENALHEGSLKAVVCTSSLDLGVDFRPVETIVQIGSPKGVARFLQRAGRSGHRPGATSIIHFVPTHSMELIEAGALKAAMKTGRVEDRIPYIRSFDVLVQYLVTLAVGGGFRPAEVLPQIRSTYAFASLSDDEWSWCLDFIVTGGSSLEAYDEYRKVIVEDGLYKVDNRRVATMHRLSIGAITSEQVLRVKYLTGGTIGTIEEYWVSQLSPGDTFWFAGRNLELVRIRGMEVQVRKSRSKKGKVPAWLGSRMDLSSHLATHLRDAVDSMSQREYPNEELAALDPLIEIQMDRSAVPNKNQLLIEYFKDREGWHLLMYPFEGRSIHEGLSALMAYRLGRFKPLSFTIAMNDYGFELLSDQPIPIEEALGSDLFNTNELLQDIQASINDAEMAGRRFRDICAIAGLTFKGYPGREKRGKHLQSSSKLFFEVFSQYEPNNLLLQQAYEEVMTFQLQELRLRQALDRINDQFVLFEQPGKATPFSFSLLVDRLRQRLSSEKLADRVKRMKLALVK
ncbi:MAG: ligase-associated DNA damage response DEXH box helicase, partial [Bacteroidota bacterium]